MADPPPFAINPSLDAEALAARFAQSGRVQIVDFLNRGGAERLHASLANEGRWHRLINGADRVFEAPADAYCAIPEAERRTLDRAVFAAAERGFQFRYDAIRVPDGDADRRRSVATVDAFARFMDSRPTRNFLSRLAVGTPVAFADAQATRYLPGDFLTRHDDNIEGKHRSLAYVMALSPEWRPEWGGLLLFNGSDGRIEETIVPRFNALSLFRVPQPHSVSYVAPYAPAPRYAVTGWLRSLRP